MLYTVYCPVLSHLLTIINNTIKASAFDHSENNSEIALSNNADFINLSTFAGFVGYFLRGFFLLHFCAYILIVNMNWVHLIAVYVCKSHVGGTLIWFRLPLLHLHGYDVLQGGERSRVIAPGIPGSVQNAHLCGGGTAYSTVCDFN